MQVNELEWLRRKRRGRTLNHRASCYPFILPGQKLDGRRVPDLILICFIGFGHGDWVSVFLDWMIAILLQDLDFENIGFSEPLIKERRS